MCPSRLMKQSIKEVFAGGRVRVKYQERVREIAGSVGKRRKPSISYESLVFGPVKYTRLFQNNLKLVDTLDQLVAVRVAIAHPCP